MLTISFPIGPLDNMNCAEEIQDLSTCSVCLLQYNDEDRHPKFLPCYHTFCLECLETMTSYEEQINCPLCRDSSSFDDPSTLANNPYALQLARSKPIKNSYNASEPRWCLACRSIADQHCPSDHHSSRINAATLQGTGSLLKFIENFQGKLERGHDQWASIVDKRRAIQSHLTQLFLSLKTLINEVECLAKENGARLRTLDSLLAIPVGPSSESFLVQFKSFVDIMELNSRSEDIDKDIERIFCVETPQELCSVTRKAAKLESQTKMRIRVLLEDNDKKIATCRQLEQGFSSQSVATTPLDQHLNVISRLVFKVLDLAKISAPILVLKLHRAGTLLGQIQIQPSAESNDQRVARLWLALTKDSLNNSIESTHIAEALPELFVALNFDMPYDGDEEEDEEEEDDHDHFIGFAGDVGIIFISDESEGVILSWQLVFLLAPIRAFVDHEFPVSSLFGTVVRGSGLLKAMSAMDSQERQGLVISIEADS